MKKVYLTKEKLEDIISLVADMIICKSADKGDYEYKIKSRNLPESLTITIEEKNDTQIGNS